MIGDAADHRPRYTLHVGGELAAIIQTLDTGADEPDHAGAAQLLAQLDPPELRSATSQYDLIVAMGVVRAGTPSAPPPADVPAAVHGCSRQRAPTLTGGCLGHMLTAVNGAQQAGSGP